MLSSFSSIQKYSILSFQSIVFFLCLYQNSTNKEFFYQIVQTFPLFIHLHTQHIAQCSCLHLINATRWHFSEIRVLDQVIIISFIQPLHSVGKSLLSFPSMSSLDNFTNKFLHVKHTYDTRSLVALWALTFSRWCLSSSPSPCPWPPRRWCWHRQPSLGVKRGQRWLRNWSEGCWTVAKSSLAQQRGSIWTITCSFWRIQDTVKLSDSKFSNLGSKDTTRSSKLKRTK